MILRKYAVILKSMELPKLPEQLSEFLISKPETGMGYQSGTVLLSDGRQFDDVLFLQAAWISEVRGFDSVPFDPQEIEHIEVTHSKCSVENI